MLDKTFFTYIATNNPRHTVIYTGVTNNLINRDDQHKVKFNRRSFTARYNVDKIVYYEVYGDIYDAITREKQIKRLVRRKKIELVNNINPQWEDLSEKMWANSNYNDEEKEN